MAGKITVGVIGCGKIAHVDHVPNLLNVKGVAITDIYDVVEKKMNLLNAAFGLGARCHGSLDALLAQQPDAVVVCTPNSLHYPQAMAALKAGCHVLCEKPMAAATPECSRMIAAAKRAGKVLHINQTLHYWPAYVTFAKLVADGAVGAVRHVRCLRFHDSSPDVGWSPGAKWFVTKAFAGGIVLDIGVHMADVMKWVAGPVAEITAFNDTLDKNIDVLDNARALLRFESGATGALELSWTAPVGGGLLELYGSKGALRMGFAPDGQMELITIGGKKKLPKTVYPKPVRKVPTSQQAFVDALLGKAPSPTPGELGRDALALCEAIMKSGETGRIVKVKRF